MTRRLVQLLVLGGAALSLAQPHPPDRPPDGLLGRGNHVMDQVHAFSLLLRADGLYVRRDLNQLTPLIPAPPPAPAGPPFVLPCTSDLPICRP